MQMKDNWVTCDQQPPLIATQQGASVCTLLLIKGHVPFTSARHLLPGPSALLKAQQGCKTEKPHPLFSQVIPSLLWEVCWGRPDVPGRDTQARFPWKLERALMLGAQGTSSPWHHLFKALSLSLSLSSPPTHLSLPLYPSPPLPTQTLTAIYRDTWL